MSIDKFSKIGGALVLFVGMVFTVLNYFQTKAEAAEQEKRQDAQVSAVVRNVVDQQNRDRASAALYNAETRLRLLNARERKSQDDLDEIEFLRDQIKRLRAEIQRS